MVGKHLFAAAAAVTNKTGGRVLLYLTWYGTGATDSQILAAVADTNSGAYTVPYYYSRVPGQAAGSVTNTLCFPLSAWASFRLTNTVGSATLLTNVAVVQ